MKRFLKAFLPITLSLSLFLTGCGSGQSATTPNTGENAQTETTAPANPEVILATTTSTQDSGLLDVLLPIFEDKTGYKVKTIAVGTGAALAMGEKGEADVLLTHAPSSEQKLVDEQVVINYNLVMHNDFVFVGPASDPAQIKGKADSVEVLQAIAGSEAIFVSRGDDSGTHKMELNLWKKANIEPSGSWYHESGSGMGQTLTIASEKEGYTLTDRGTYLSMKDSLNLDILFEGEASLLNIYHVMQVNPEKFPLVNGDGAKAFVEFMIDPETQDLIGEFGIEEFGQPLFFPDAGKTMEELGM